jgi:hypothetical protein
MSPLSLSPTRGKSRSCQRELLRKIFLKSFFGFKVPETVAVDGGSSAGAASGFVLQPSQQVKRDYWLCCGAAVTSGSAASTLGRCLE